MIKLMKIHVSHSAADTAAAAKAAAAAKEAAVKEADRLTKLAEQRI